MSESLLLVQPRADAYQRQCKRSYQLCQDLCIHCVTGEGTLVRCKRTQEGDKEEGPSKRAKREQGMEKLSGTEFQGLLEEVSESNWLLCQLWQSVEGFHNNVCKLARGLERAELLQKLGGLVDD